MRRTVPFSLILLVLSFRVAFAHDGNPESFKLTPEWSEKVRSLAPKSPSAQPKGDRKVLVFSLTTGFDHWCIPHTDAVVEILGDESGAYTSVFSDDIEVFLPDSLRQFDAVVLNNNCPDREDRDIFRDVLINKVDEFGKRYSSMPLPQREALASELFGSLKDFVADGGGLVVLHGAIANFNYDESFSEIVGGSFDFHPPSQEVTLSLVDPGHPLLAPFEGKEFVHFDEPYLFNGAYADFDFEPLLEIEMDLLKPHKRLRKLPEIPRYSAWIKPHGNGRVFYCSPSHFAQSFERPELLGFILNGIQYAIGDFDVGLADDDS